MSDKPENSGKSENSDNLNKANKPKKPKKPKKVFSLSQQYIDSTIPPIVKNELIEEDVMKYTTKGDYVPKKSIEIYEALKEKTDFQKVYTCTDEKNTFYYYRKDIENYEKYSLAEVKIIMCRILLKFPYPALRANSLLLRICQEDENSIDEIDGDSSMDL